MRTLIRRRRVQSFYVRSQLSVGIAEFCVDYKIINHIPIPIPIYCCRLILLCGKSGSYIFFLTLFLLKSYNLFEEWDLYSWSLHSFCNWSILLLLFEFNFGSVSIGILDFIFFLLISSNILYDGGLRWIFFHYSFVLLFLKNYRICRPIVWNDHFLLWW